jgi:hypothetical protein
MTVEIFLGVLFLFLVLLGGLIVRQLHHYNKLLLKHEELKQAELESLKEEFKKQHEVEFTITERIGCLGYYRDREIPSHIKIEDGRLFEYVSLAIKLPEGHYKATDPSALHIRVDDNLLYKLVEDQK